VIYHLRPLSLEDEQKLPQQGRARGVRQGDFIFIFAFIFEMIENYRNTLRTRLIYQDSAPLPLDASTILVSVIAGHA